MVTEKLANVQLLYLKVWNTITGAKQYTFEGHGAPVYSLCAHAKENVHVIIFLHTAKSCNLLLFIKYLNHSD